MNIRFICKDEYMKVGGEERINLEGDFYWEWEGWEKEIGCRNDEMKVWNCEIKK